jgi:hypothetical protein
MSAYRCPGTVVRFDQKQPPRLAPGSRWRKAARGALASIGDSDWDWTELKQPVARRKTATPARQKQGTVRASGFTRPTPGQPHWQA